MIASRALRHSSFIALVACLLQLSAAKDLYLDCSSSNSDGDGSKSNPFSSITEANKAVLSAGDTLSIKSDTTCSGTLSPQGSGTQEKPIILTSYGDGPLPIINGSGAAEAVSLTNQDYWEISNIAVINPAAKIAWRRGILATSSDGTVHRGLYIHDVTVYNVAGETNKARNPVHSSPQAESWSTAPSITAATTTSKYSTTQFMTAVAAASSPRVHVFSNNISYVGGDGIVVSYGLSPLIESNLCGFLGHGKYPWTGGNFAGIWVLGCRDAVMRFNAVHDSLMSEIDSEAFDCDWGNEGTCTVEYNYSHDNAGGIFLNCDGCGTPGGARQIVRYNIFQNDCRMYSNGDNVELDFYNNVVYCPDKKFEIAVPPKTNMSNNIWVGTQDSTLPTGDSIEWHGNLFQTVPQPGDTAGIDGDALFIDPGTGKDTIDSVDGYKLRSGSPALLKGVVVSDNGGRDFWNNKVSSEQRPNIGSYNGKGL
ncbi:hypothetical protein AARAC_001576 [Aspergillus arachidicola]|uniref:Right handed beta helix domain-containing protein n=1 Tax=Aspergillus arachidicola TaxID=656916 RepID=A0A2G7G5H0_9EURO|nr:hypothetical protein AARAC_001576 [Aspergillus arachidicola]